MSLLNLQLPLYRIHRPSFSHQSYKQPQSSTLAPSNFLCLASSSSNPYSSEEARWLREEQRWLREEQRWIRQESLWISERESLKREISELKLKIQKLEAERDDRYPGSVPETLSRIAILLQSLKGSSTSPVSRVSTEIGEVAASSFGESIASVSDTESLPAPASPSPPPVVEQKPPRVTNKRMTNSTRRPLKRGSEGDEVQALQEALMKLGFYCGEEDMEYSSFDEGTERAVKTWQASLGGKEDGIMTSELLDLLFNDVDPHQSESSSILKNQNGGVAVSSIEITEVEEKISKPRESNKVEVPRNRVYLLGENRWEDPSRLTIGNDKQANDTKAQSSSTKCYNCRGEGRLMCIECDGSGEPNIESQFLEWVDEGANCPYCDGLGYTICDVCVGQTAV